MKILALIAAVFATGVAHADSPAPAPVSPAPEVATNDWSGFYAGLSHGMASGEMFDIGGPYVLNDDASFTSGFIGYRHDMGRYVIGGELSTSFDVNMYQASFPTWTFNSVTDLRAILGYDAGRTLIYAAAGFTTSEFDGDGTVYTYDGWNAGIGVDVLVSDRVFLGAEYVYREVERTDMASWNATFDTFHLRIGMNF